MRRASTHTSHTQSHFPHIPLRPTEPKPLTQNYNRVFALPSELQHLSKLEGFESSTRHPFFFFNELLLFYKDKTFLFNCQIFFVFFLVLIKTIDLISYTKIIKFFLTIKYFLCFFSVVKVG